MNARSTWPIRKEPPNGAFLEKEPQEGEGRTAGPQQPSGACEGGLHTPRPHQDGFDDERRRPHPEVRTHPRADRPVERSEEHTSELQSRFGISYAAFSLN